MTWTRWWCAALAAACGGAASAQVLPGQGLSFSQVDLAMPGVSPQPGSQYGMAIVDVPALLGSHGSGFLNISTSQGWVVRNMPIDAGMVAAGLPGMSMMFDLGDNPGSISMLQTFADVSPTPVASFGATPVVPFGISPLTYNAQGGDQGGGPNRSGPTGHRVNWAGINFNPGGQTSLVWQPNHSSNVEQAVNQCGPASVANSYTYLKNRYGLNVPHANTPGVNGVPAGSLVGQMDVQMNRIAGQGVTRDQFFNGKTGYLQNNGLAGTLQIKQYGAYAGQQLINNYPVGDGAASGLSMIDWMISELEHGENVEMWMNWAGGGAHLVDLVGGGKIGGVPFLAWIHDFKQGDNTTGTSFFSGGYGFSFLDAATGKIKNFVGSGLGVQQIDDATIRFAASESIPSPATIGLLAMAGVIAARRRRR
jgi:hypothetical protein